VEGVVQVLARRLALPGVQQLTIVGDEVVHGSAAALTAGLLEAEDERQEAETTDAVPVEIADADLLGVGGGGMPFREVIADGGWATAGVLFGLNLVDEFDRVALQILAPDIQRTFGMSDGALAFVNGIGGLFLFAGAIPLGMLADRRTRTRIIAVSSTVWSAFALLGGLTANTFQFAVTRAFNGIGKGNEPAQRSLLADAYPLEGRGRIFAFHGLANNVGTCIGPLLAGGVAVLAGGTEGWRWSLVVLAVPCLVLAAASARLREPERGRHERAATYGPAADLAAADDVLPAKVSISAAFERLKKIKTFYFVMAALGALGFAIAGAPTIFNLYLDDRFALSALERGVTASVIALGSGVGSVMGGRKADELYRRGPQTILVLVGMSLVVFGLLYPVALFMPNVVLLTAVLLVAFGFISATTVASTTVVAAIVPFTIRGLGFALMNLYLVLVGGLAGGVLAGVLSDRYGERTALCLIVPASCIAAGALVAHAGKYVRSDIAMVAEELREEHENTRRRTSGRAEDTPVLQVRDLDFSYGLVQVLFDVDLDVRRGEVLALLGTNGAGKSTLLRAICGLSPPDRGVVRLEGRNITYMSAEDRVGLGMVQVPGGKANFPDLSVYDNLLAGCYSFVWYTDLVAERITRALDLFPRLAERLEQPAGTLSGGEQQMLAIAKALLLEPRVLLIDELSLGLAPVVVQDLLGVVERLKADGVTIVLVEQSVNVALSVADRAVFMEKGSVRFEGPAADLLGRDDLVRAVFLGTEGG
jgi:ABC-type branched-subunit amino acid transport system ATPase component/sugar phosphate permease